MWVGGVAQHVGVGQLLGLDHRMQRPGAVEAPFPHGELLEEIEHHQRRDPLGRSREFADGPAAVGGADRGDPIRLQLAKVVRRHEPALLLRQPHDRVGHRPRVESIAPMLGDAPQRSGEIGIPEEVAFLWRACPVEQKRRFAVRLC